MTRKPSKATTALVAISCCVLASPIWRKIAAGKLRHDTVKHINCKTLAIQVSDQIGSSKVHGGRSAQTDPHSEEGRKGTGFLPTHSVCPDIIHQTRHGFKEPRFHRPGPLDRDHQHRWECARSISRRSLQFQQEPSEAIRLPLKLHQTPPATPQHNRLSCPIDASRDLLKKKRKVHKNKKTAPGITAKTVGGSFFVTITVRDINQVRCHPGQLGFRLPLITVDMPSGSNW